MNRHPQFAVAKPTIRMAARCTPRRSSGYLPPSAAAHP